MLPVALLAALVGATGLTEPEVAAALRGEVPVRSEEFVAPGGRAAGRGLGAIVVERPIANVWATVSHYEDKAEYVPRIESSTVLEKKPGLLRVRMEVDATVTTARYTAWFTLDEKAHTIHWRLDPSAPDNTIAGVDGEYVLVELAPARTLLVYRTWVDVGRGVPRFIREYLARRSIPDLLRAIKRRIESGGLWRK